MYWADNHQKTYYTGVIDDPSSSSDAFDAMQTSVSYTGGASYDIGRLGNNTANNIDHSQNTVNTIDLLLGLGGNDTISAGLGADYLYGGKGNDSITAGTGHDKVYGEEDDDTLLGGDGNDTFHYAGTASGFDSVDGGDGTDVIQATSDYAVIGLSRVANVESVAANGFVGVYIAGSDGDDVLNFENTILDNNLGPTFLAGGTDVYTGSAGLDIVHGDADDDNLSGGGGVDILFGGTGDDWLVGGDDGDNLNGDDDNDHLLGEFGDDELFGGDGNDSVDGGDGVDYLVGMGGDDTLQGGAGIDTYEGGDGNDRVIVGDGVDLSADGGDGWDVLSLEDASAGITASLSASTTVLGGVGIANFEVFSLTDFGDVVTASDVEIWGGYGNDTLSGGIGNAWLYGDEGNDVLTGGGAAIGTDYLQGGDGDDTYHIGLNTYVSDNEGSDVIHLPSGSGYSSNIVTAIIDGLYLDVLDVSESIATAELSWGDGTDTLMFNNVAVTDLTIHKSLVFQHDGMPFERSFFMGESNAGDFFIEAYYSLWFTPEFEEPLQKAELVLNFTGDISDTWEEELFPQDLLDLMQGSIQSSVKIENSWAETGIAVSADSSVWGGEHLSTVLDGTLGYNWTNFYPYMWA